MHPGVLNKAQKELIPLVTLFKREFYLVGGTAIALQTGHRRSIDFDLFKYSSLHPHKILKKISAAGFDYRITRHVEDQLNLMIGEVNFTFFQYPFEIKTSLAFEGIRMPALLTLAAMKAYALGRRSKWKDYVDLYYILKNHHSLDEIVHAAGEIYGQLFSEKLFRAQLSYFEDIDMREPVEWLLPEVPVKEIQEYLINISTDIF